MAGNEKSTHISEEYTHNGGDRYIPSRTDAGEERFAVEMTGITYPDPRYHIEREHSPLHCMEYVISGEGHIVMDGREYRPKAGDAYLLAAGKDHSYWADADRPWKKSG